MSSSKIIDSDEKNFSLINRYNRKLRSKKCVKIMIQKCVVIHQINKDDYTSTISIPNLTL